MANINYFLFKSLIYKNSRSIVGDKISIPFLAVVSASGYKIPMIAGSGPRQTDGIIDKLEAIKISKQV